jgi:predicted alpha/beta-hydrolase family hydrolase
MADFKVRIPAGAVRLEGDLSVPGGASGVIVFAHGSGSSRLSPRNTAVAAYLRRTGRFGTLLFDLLSDREDAVYATRFDIGLLAERRPWSQRRGATTSPRS